MKKIFYLKKKKNALNRVGNKLINLKLKKFKYKRIFNKMMDS